MINRSIESILFLAFLNIACASEELPILEVRLPSQYSGWVFLVENRSAAFRYEVSIDSNGVGYIPSEMFKRRFDIKIIRDEEDISDICEDHGNGQSNVPIYGYPPDLIVRSGSFYVPPENVPGSVRSPKGIAGMFLIELMQEGKIVINVGK